MSDNYQLARGRACARHTRILERAPPQAMLDVWLLLPRD
jgi:hypothetical protein